jgi:hypothetical protein
MKKTSSAVSLVNESDSLPADIYICQFHDSGSGRRIETAIGHSAPVHPDDLVNHLNAYAVEEGLSTATTSCKVRGMTRGLSLFIGEAGMTAADLAGYMAAL